MKTIKLKIKRILRVKGNHVPVMN